MNNFEVVLRILADFRPSNYANDWLMMIDLMSNSIGLLMLHRPQHRLNFYKGLEAVNRLVPL